MCAFFGVESSNWDLLLQAGLLLGVCLLFLAVVPPQFKNEEQVRDRRYRLYVGVLLGTLAIGAMFVVFSLQVSILAISATVFVAGTRTVVWDIRRPSPGHQFEGDRKYVEAAIEPGDDVYVHGRAREHSDGSLVLEGREDCEHEFVVSRHRKRRTVRTLTRSSRVALARLLGAALGGFTLVTMVVVEVVL